MTAALSIERLRDHGVVGAGGAGFPTYEKLGSRVEIAIANAAECEPLLHKDKEILHHHGEEVLDGLLQVAAAVGASRAQLAIKEKYEELITELTGPCASRGIEICRLGDFYPAGDEFITVAETTGRVIPPGGLPRDVGCLVQNVETLLNVRRDAPVTHKYLSIAGDVPEPVTVRAPIGISYGDVFTALGIEPSSIGAVLIGGVMMGQAMASFDEVVTRTTGALLCFPADHVVPRKYGLGPPIKSRIGRSACDQCSFCTELCPRYLLGHPVEPHVAMRGLGFNMLGDAPILGSQFCCECNLCSLYSCPEDLFPMEACRDNKQVMRERQLSHPAAGRTDLPAHSMRDHRHVPIKSLIDKLGLARFRNVGPLVEVDWRPPRLRIPLKQHIGAPARPTVGPGETVDAGTMIGAAPEGALGVAIHASMNGTVVSVDDDIVLQTGR